MELKTLATVRTLLRRNVAKHVSNNRVAKHSFEYFASSGIPSNALLAEDGTPILNEDGSYILVE